MLAFVKLISYPSLRVAKFTKNWQVSIFSLLLLALPNPTEAQVVPDNTLPNNSTVSTKGSIFTINGGTQAGNNLFHSFQEFSVPKNSEAFFNNSINNVQNIFSRVTGGKISNIDGLIRSNGSANLFLLNPNGIIFGENAKLNIGGSFIATTANSIKFSDGIEFSATNPFARPLLTINVPVGLQFGLNPGSIINQSKLDTSNNQVALGVQPGQMLALLGGNIFLEGGNLTANGGQIILGSIKSPDYVSFTSTLQGLDLNYENIQNFGNIQISSGAVIDTSGIGGGRVDIRGKNVTLSGSQILARTLGNLNGKDININAQELRVKNGSLISTSTLGEGRGGRVNILATDLVELSGIGFESYQRFVGEYLTQGRIDPLNQNLVLVTGSAGSGAAGDIAINTYKLLLRDGAVLASSTLGAGNGGNMTINAKNVEIAGSVINSGTLRNSGGKGGDINIDTERLTVRDGGVLVTVSQSEGASGNIAIQADESVEVLRTLPGTVVQTLIGTNALNPNGRGTGGNITINTKRLQVADGAGISLSAGGIIGEEFLFTPMGEGGNLTIKASESVEVTGVSGVLANGGQGPSFLAVESTNSNRGGNIDISTPRLVLRDGGIITVASLGAGDAGKITINANRVEVIGSGGNGKFTSKIEASVGSLFSFSNPNAEGIGGELKFNVGQLIVRDGALINVLALGKASAGNLNVNADAIALDTLARLDGSTGSGGGGNINLQARDIQLRGGSRIRTDAGNADGGNITINTDTLVALENSDISANALQGRGGQVTITTKGIFGTAFRNNVTPESDITATSKLGLQFNGIVQINSPNVNPSNSLVPLPENFIEPKSQIVQTCWAQARSNNFVITGRGGLPANTREILNSPPTWIDWRVATTQEASETEKSPNIQSPIPTPLIEATGWIVDSEGVVKLVALDGDTSYQQKQTCQTDH